MKKEREKIGRIADAAVCQGECGIPHKRMCGGYAAKAPLQTVACQNIMEQGELINALLINSP